MTDEQWATPSLCGEWTVQQVLAHQLSAAKMTPLKFVAKLAGAGFNFNKFTAKQVAREGSGGPAATLAAFQLAAEPRRLAPPGPKDTWLGEAFVHGEDIRRPLGIEREYPLPEVARALTFYAGSDTIIGGKTRMSGLTFKATDADFSIGRGPVVEGPLDLAVARRDRTQVRARRLSGPGVELLSTRS